MTTLKNIFGIHDSIAADVHAKGERYVLRCKQCGKKSPCSERDFSRYLAKGWPKCCERTMALERTDS